MGLESQLAYPSALLPAFKLLKLSGARLHKFGTLAESNSLRIRVRRLSKCVQPGHP